MNSTITSKSTARRFELSAPRLIAMLALVALVVALVLGAGSLLFVPSQAAYYDIPHAGSAASGDALPFGPGIAADYGIPHAVSAGSGNALPFGPGIAADYGIPADRSYDDIEHVRATRSQSLLSVSCQRLNIR